MLLWNKILFTFLTAASLFSVAYMTGLIKDTRYVYDGIVQEAEYDEHCLQQANPNRIQDEQISALSVLLYGYEKCIINEAVYGYAACDFKTKSTRIERCFGVKEFSPTKTAVLGLVSLTGLMYFKIKKIKLY